MENFILYAISPMLSEPEAAKVTRQGNSVVIKVADSDVGKVIGKHGHVIHSLRTLLKTYCSIHELPFSSLLLDSPQKPTA